MMTSSTSTLNRTAAELFAAAALELFPTAKLVGGGTTDIGFFYELIFPQPLDEQSFKLLEEAFHRLIKAALPVQFVEMMRENASTLFEHLGQKLLAKEIATDPCNIVSICHVGDYKGYAPEPSIENSSEVRGCKLLGYSAYQTAPVDGETQTVNRIEGVAFYLQKELKKFLKRLENAKKCDHQKIGVELELFIHHPKAPRGCWTWLQKGTFLRQMLTDFWRQEMQKLGAQFILTPHQTPFRPSKEGPLLYHLDLFASKTRSYRGLPYQSAEIVESLTPAPTKELFGLFRPYTYTEMMAYRFCSEEDSLKQVISSLHSICKTINMFGVESKWYLVSPSPKSAKKTVPWEREHKLLADSAKELGINCIADQGKELAIEGRLIDPLGREWPGPSLKFPFLGPEETCRYHNRHGKQRSATVMAWSLFGPLERFIAVLVENLRGVFPLWLAPEQVRIIPVSEKCGKYAEQVREQLQGVRADVDHSDDTLAAKVYAAKRTKIPYAVVVGESEQRDGTIAISPFYGKGKGKTERPEVFLKALQEELAKSPFECLLGTQIGDKRLLENQ